MIVMSKKGQLSITGVLSFLILFILMIALFPVIKNFVEIGQNSTNDTSEDLLIGLIPVILLIGLIATLVLYISPTFVRTQQY